MTHTKQEKHAVPHQIEGVFGIRKFLASREGTNPRQRTSGQIQTKDTHSSVAGATEP